MTIKCPKCRKDYSELVDSQECPHTPYGLLLTLTGSDRQRELDALRARGIVPLYAAAPSIVFRDLR